MVSGTDPRLHLVEISLTMEVSTDPARLQELQQLAGNNRSPFCLLFLVLL